MATVNIDLSCDLFKPVYVLHRCEMLKSTDTNKINVAIKDGSISGTVTAYATKADGTTSTATGSISGNVASVTLPSSFFSVPGLVSITVKVASSGSVTTIAAIVVCV